MRLTYDVIADVIRELRRDYKDIYLFDWEYDFDPKYGITRVTLKMGQYCDSIAFTREMIMFSRSKDEKSQYEYFKRFLTDSLIRLIKAYEGVNMNTVQGVKEFINDRYGIYSMKQEFNAKLTYIKEVLYKDPATIIFWSDGTKTVVKCGEGETFDPEKGLAMAIIKKMYGNNKGNYYNIFRKWLPKEEKKKDDLDGYEMLSLYCRKNQKHASNMRKLCREGKVDCKKVNSMWFIKVK